MKDPTSTIEDAIEAVECVDNPCEHKDHPDYYCEGEIKNKQAMTRYHWDGTGRDPNKDFLACEAHWKACESYWKEQWQDYYDTIGFP